MVFMPSCPGLTSITLTPGCGFPVVRFITVPSIAANSEAVPTRSSAET
jgi:hypothetical protein